MRNKIIIPVFMFLLLVFSVSAIKVETAECYGDGSFKIDLKANSEKYSYTKEMFITADGKRMKGFWDIDKLALTDTREKRATFSGQENQLIEKKNYNMLISFKERLGDLVEDAELSFELECPGLSFTCQRLGIRINDCLTSKQGKFTANLDVYGLEQSPKETLNPLKVITYVLQTQILYKDINGYTSKRGSMPQGATVIKVAENKYFIESYFDKYTTNHVETMLVRFNDELPRACNPTDYPSLILSHSMDCEYKETEEDFLADNKEQEEKEDLVLGSLPSGIMDTPVTQLKEDVYSEINALEAKRSEIEARLNELYQQREEVSNEEVDEEPKNTGYSVKESSEESSKKKQRLNILLLFLLGVVVVGGVLLTYLYKEGYFY